MTLSQDAKSVTATAAARKVFLGVGAIVARLRGTGTTKWCDVVANLTSKPSPVPDWSNGPTIPIDLSKMGENTTFSGMLFDDFGIDKDGNPMDEKSEFKDGATVTSIGRQWPHGKFFGGLFMLHSEFEKYRIHVEWGEQVWPASNEAYYYPEQFITLRYDAAVTRFMGFTVQMASDLKLKFRYPGKGTFSQEIAIDLSKADLTVDEDLLGGKPSLSPRLPVRDGKPDGAPSKNYSLFLELKYAASLWPYGLMTPKLPFWMQ